MAKHAKSNADVCAAHCVSAEQLTAQADAPLPPAAPQPPLTLRLVAPYVAMPAVAAAARPVFATPPPLLVSGRLLI